MRGRKGGEERGGRRVRKRGVEEEKGVEVEVHRERERG